MTNRKENDSNNQNNNQIDFEFLSEQKSLTKDITDVCYVLGVFEENRENNYSNRFSDDLYQKIVIPLMNKYKFKGENDSVVSLNGLQQQLSQLVIVGLGKELNLDEEIIRKSASTIYWECSRFHVQTILLDFPIFTNFSYLKAFLEGIMLTDYSDQRFKSSPDKSFATIKKVYISLPSSFSKQTNNAIHVAKLITNAVNLTKNLAYAPANYVTPSELAKTALEIAKDYGMDIKILEKEDCKKLKMGCYLSVTNGSNTAPKFIHLTYRSKNPNKKFLSYSKVAFVGKGVTFDSGGINLKVGSRSEIEMMKYDMTGVAVLLGLAKIVGEIKPDLELHFIMPTTENMIGSNATKPGDIVTASNGKTVEITNTDAEGRLILADALVYAEKLNVDCIIDLATLTGAVSIALGDDIAAMLGTEQKIMNSLLQSSQRTGEKLWQLPLEISYFKKNMSSILADMVNSSKRYSGSVINSALFLKQFVDKTPWVHLDIAGVSEISSYKYYCNPGATGFGVRLLFDWICNL